MKPRVLALLLAPLSLSGCNALALTLALAGQPTLQPTEASGTFAQATADTKVGYLTWIEQKRNGHVQGQLNFDLVRDRTTAFDESVPIQDGRFSLRVTPQPEVAEGTYVLFAWEDLNHNGLYEADQNERRAPEIYRLRGQATGQGLWTTEKLVFTDKRLAIEYANLAGGLSFAFN